MNSIEETVRISRLLEIYGELLSKVQYEIMCDYYWANLSLSEISQLRKISRTAVSDAIKKGVEKLNNCEEKVGICRVLDEFKDDPTAREIDRRLRHGI